MLNITLKHLEIDKLPGVRGHRVDTRRYASAPAELLMNRKKEKKKKTPTELLLNSSVVLNRNR
jgi:hypothetical protein